MSTNFFLKGILHNVWLLFFIESLNQPKELGQEIAVATNVTQDPCGVIFFKLFFVVVAVIVLCHQEDCYRSLK